MLSYITTEIYTFPCTKQYELCVMSANKYENK